MDYRASHRTNNRRRTNERNRNIGDLSAKITKKIENVLDQNPDTSNWRAFLTVASDLDENYDFSQIDIENKIGRCVFEGSPTNRMITELAARGMVVHELVHILDQLKLENVLVDLKDYEEIRIVRNPAETKQLRAGDKLELEVEATGFPYPRYQWFKLNNKEYDEIEGAKEATYKISKVSMKDSGTYCCRLWNGGENHQCKFTVPSVVKVHYRPSSPVQEPLSPIADNDGPQKVILPQVLTEPGDVCCFHGDRLELVCEAIGQKPLTYEWRKDGNVVSSEKNTGKFVIDNSTSSSKGTYTCIVRNQFGKTHSRQVEVEVKDTPVYDPGASEDIDIILNPKICSVELGGSCMFSVRAKCRQKLNYQWYRDGKAIPGATDPDLKMFNLQEREKQGLYQCQISSRDKMVLSHPASLSIKPPTENAEYRPTDKVALLIGNYDYMNESPLRAPKNDVAKMAEAFRSLEFKVVALLNLTKKEMTAAIHEFCNLLGKGVYGVFYFCGHGFEENGQCYFVPPDARSGYTVEDCISSRDVHRCMQRSKPALVTLILDICRIRNKITSPNPPKEGNIVFTGRESPSSDQRGNSIYIYATSEGMYAYEDQENGILVKYLQKFIYLNEPVWSFFNKVIDAWRQDPMHSTLQIPEIRSTLIDWRRSLSDRILPTGYTQAYNTRKLMWQKAHETPKKIEIKMPELGNLVVELNFQMEFSNVLQVFALIKHPGNTFRSIAFPYGWPKSISMMGDIKNVSTCPQRGAETKSTFQDLQKLREDLELQIVVKYCMRDEQDKLSFSEKINLGLPLIAKLHLYNYKDGVTEPIEHLEET